MKKVRVGVIGAQGRMGQEICRLLGEARNMRLAAEIGRDRGRGEVGEVDVWIDFSSPEALAEHLKFALKNGQAYVCGTTGLSAAQTKLLKSAAKKIPVLWSSNMSLGVTVLNEALKVFAALKAFDFQIEEIHHNRKKDKPSGTALTLQQNLEKAVGRSLPAPLSIRGGGVFGVHKILAMSDEEVISFEHAALNRTVFARGAVKAAAWIAGRQPGFYSMSDCLF